MTTGDKQAFKVPDALAKLWMSLDECCTTLGKSRFTISAWCREGILDRMAYGRNVLISRESVEKYLRKFQPVVASTPAKSGRRRK